MSDPIAIPFPESTIITAVEVYLKRKFFKQPHKITAVEPAEKKGIFIVTCEPINGEPQVSKPRKASQRGLKGPVLTPPVVNGREAEVAAE